MNTAIFRKFFYYVCNLLNALFLNRYGQRLSRRGIQKVVRRYATQTEIRDRVHPHTLRHTFATHMLEGGADLRVIQELLGHSNPITTQVYTHVTNQEALTAYLNHHPRSGLSGSTYDKEISGYKKSPNLASSNNGRWETASQESDDNESSYEDLSHSGKAIEGSGG